MTSDVLNEAQRAEEARDLSRSLGNLGLDDEEQRYFILKETSPPRRKTRLWSMEDGSSYMFLNFRVRAMLDQTMPDGRPRWTAYEERAPQIKISEYPCFLAPESDIRAELDALGIVVRCTSKHPSRFAMEQVASKKHPGSWRSWQAHLAEKRANEDRVMQQQQVTAMMTLASGVSQSHGAEWLDAMQSPVAVAATKAAAAGIVERVISAMTCECGWTTEKGNQSMAIHKRLHCPLRASASTVAPQEIEENDG